MDAEVLTIKGEKFALLPLKTWEKLQNYLDELQDIADCNEIKACIERGEGEYFPAKVVDALIDGENPVKIYRGYRGLTQAELAEKAGLSVDMIKKIEGGKSDGSIKSIKAIAQVLNVDIEDII